MKEVMLKWLENKRLMFERLHCGHKWKRIENFHVEGTNNFTKQPYKYDVIFYVCEKCGDFKEIKPTY